MRIGFLTHGSVERLDWAAQNGFGSFEWMCFDDSPAEPATNPLAGQKLEDTGLLIAKRTLEQFVPRENP